MSVRAWRRKKKRLLLFLLLILILPAATVSFIRHCRGGGDRSTHGLRSRRARAYNTAAFFGHQPHSSSGAGVCQGCTVVCRRHCNTVSNRFVKEDHDSALRTTATVIIPTDSKPALSLSSLSSFIDEARGGAKEGEGQGTNAEDEGMTISMQHHMLLILENQQRQLMDMHASMSRMEEKISQLLRHQQQQEQLRRTMTMNGLPQYRMMGGIFGRGGEGNGANGDIDLHVSGASERQASCPLIMEMPLNFDNAPVPPYPSSLPPPPPPPPPLITSTSSDSYVIYLVTSSGLNNDNTVANVYVLHS